jgi:hypothetical protein
LVYFIFLIGSLIIANQRGNLPAGDPVAYAMHDRSFPSDKAMGCERLTRFSPWANAAFNGN